MGATTLKTAVGAYIQKVNALVGQAAGPKGHALYVDNQAGEFAFEPGEVVAVITAIDEDTDLALTKTRIESNTPGIGSRIVDLRTGEQYTWSAGSWSNQTLALDGVLKPGRLCFCPNTRKAFYRDLNGNVRQILQ